MENDIQNSGNIDIIILANGPGELSSYVKPTAEAIKGHAIKTRIIIVLTPCPYSTGKEEHIARNIPGVSLVISSSDFIKWALLRKSPKNVTFYKKGVVLFMGGDILYGKILAKRLKYPAFAYSEAYAKWPKIYKKFFVPDKMAQDKLIRQGFPKEQIKIVGNLMVDSIILNKSKADIFNILKLDPKKRLISFLPGSREFQVQFTFNFFSKVAKEMTNNNPDFQFAFIVSPYLPEKYIKKHLKNEYLEINGNKIKMIYSDQHDVIAASDLVITVPGTNTAEVAIIGTPMIVTFPLASAHLIPLEGIFQIIGKIPLLGFFFKNFYVKIVQRKTRFFAIPNIKADKEIVPELTGNIQPGTVAEKAVVLLDNKDSMAKMRTALKVSLGAPGAADKIAKEILNEIIHKTA